MATKSKPRTTEKVSPPQRIARKPVKQGGISPAKRKPAAGPTESDAVFQAAGAGAPARDPNGSNGLRQLTILDRASQAILSVGADGRIAMANRMTETMFGYSREELLDMLLENLLPERFRASHAKHRTRYFPAPEARPMGSGLELKGLRKDGTEFPIDSALNCVHTKDGTLAIAFITDLSERQHAEDALRESEARFSLFMEYMPAAAFLKDLKGRYVYVSPGFVKSAGRAPGLYPGASDEEYWPDSAERLRREDRQVIQTGHAVTAEDSRTVGSETRHYQTVRFPIPGKDGATALVGGISVDITARKVAEQERQSLLARLATAHEEERWRISRELHDDLTQRLAMLAMDLGRIAAQPPPSARLLGKGIRSLQRRVVQAAEASRHLAHELHPLELDDLGLVAALRFYCEDFAKREGIAVELESRDVPKELKREIGACVYKVAQESLSNIAKHAAAERVSILLEGAGDMIRLRVKDSGIGFRAESPETKLGLGLLSMKERVGLLRGDIKIWSQPGQGTEVTVVVPLEAR